jgi:hypothetical protein
MIKNNYGEMIFDEADICDLLMSGRELTTLDNILVDGTVNLEAAVDIMNDLPMFKYYKYVPDNQLLVNDWDTVQQSHWHMPSEYKQLDIAAYVLSLCSGEAELQRCGQELLLYQERNLFDLLRYLKYLVDVMKENRVIWGVGRGSSVASFVLYKLEVHRVDSLYYDLNIAEFLR